MKYTLPHRRARGQAAAMMALTMMLIALMVCITLGVGMKVKEKMEAQTLADASAYSGAVLTARTFNSIAILNRVEIAEMVSVVATQSLAAYGGYYRAMLWSAREQLQIQHDKPGVCPDDGTCNWCTKYTTMMAALDAESTRITTDWYRFDHDTTLYIEGRGAAGTAYGAADALYLGLRDDAIIGRGGNPPMFNTIVQRVAQNSEWPNELTAPSTVNTINTREIGTAANCDATSGELVCEGGPSEISIQAAMGTRGYDFERNASNLSQMLENGLMTVVGMSPLTGDAVNVVGFQGSTRFVDRPDYHGRPGGMGIVGENMEGQLKLSVMSNGCGPQTTNPSPVQSWVYSTSYLNTNDLHFYSWVDRNGVVQTYNEPQGWHAFPNANCPPYNIPPCGMWPGFMDINPSHVDPQAKFQHLYGQPKVTAVVQRDYQVRGARADPWNLLYTMSVRRSSPEQFDNNGMTTAQGIDISKQTAIASGLAYYHRQGHWKEPPNLYNPYWRATLVSTAIDTDGYPIGGGGADLQTATANAPFAQDVVNQLAQAGFHGWQ
jgi:putative Flp pilus-assembly TadE/G-like protein